MPDVMAPDGRHVHSVLRSEVFVLTDAEVETLRRAAADRSMPFDPDRREYTRLELARHGLVREAYTRAELHQVAPAAAEISSFDQIAQDARELLRVDAPFGSDVCKWQLPIDMMPIRVHQAEFPANTVVHSHVHPPNSPEDPGGSLRVVTKGKIFFKERTYEAGDWFFVPNGVPYTFSTDPAGLTTVMYTYRFFRAEEGNRFSHPIAHDE